ncbi:MAG: amino acid ABC transporter substrate-binding protein [Firmicutes bacterium]|nr:amino acid ABC transporter substrate-binding protein [Bacillota bacterium]
MIILLLVAGLLLAGCKKSGDKPNTAPAPAPSEPAKTAPPKEEPKKEEQGVIKIGAAISFTGPLSRNAAFMKQGYDLWVEDVNARGGIDVGGKKYKVELKLYDDKSDAPTAANLVEKLITEDKVNFILGPYGSGITTAVSAISEKYKVLMLAPIANADPVYARGFKYLFGMLPPISRGTAVHVDLMKSLNPTPKTLAILTPDDMFPLIAAEGVKKKAEANGIQVVYFQKYPKDTQDLSTILTEMKRLQPDAVMTTGYFQDAFLTIKQMRDLRVNVKYMGALDAPFQEDFRKALGKDAEYVFAEAEWVPSAGWKGPVFGSSQDYNAKFKARYGADANYYSAAPSAAGIVLEAAIQKAGSLDNDKVREAILSLDMETFYGPIKYDVTGWNNTSTALIVQIQDGNLVTVYPSKLKQAEPRYPMPGWQSR